MPVFYVKIFSPYSIAKVLQSLWFPALLAGYLPITGLNDTEKDIIEKHMWPLTIRLPKNKESLVVSLVDKYCSFMEIAKIQSKPRFLDSTN